MRYKEGTKLIIRSNEDEPYQIGEVVGYSDMPSPDDIPVVDVDGFKLVVFGIHLPYNAALVERLDKLTPNQQWELLWTIRDNDCGRKLILMRGLPGSGKSTLAKELAGQFGQVFSTDDFFCLNEDDEYRFDGSKLGPAHDWNQRRSLAALHERLPIIVIDNTNTTVRELLSYLPHIKLARELHYTVSIREPETDWRFKPNDLFARGSHNVPQAHIEKMLKRYAKDIKMEDILFRD
jgi:predicted kinase